MVVGEIEAIRDGVLTVAKLMTVAAKTAPKARGIDNIIVKILSTRDELEELAKKMEELAPRYGNFFERDAMSVRQSDAVVLIGVKVVDLGLKTPENYRIDINVAMALINLGIALGSAVKVAAMHNVDNRIMYSVGLAAQMMGLIDADFVIGIPLSVKGKNIYFDRRWP